MRGWYVVQSKPQKEQWLCNQFNALQIEAYYPCLHTSNGKSHVHKPKPYFPGYLFVNVDLELTGISMLQWVPGSLGLVTFGGEPACVPDGLVQTIQHRVDEMNSSKGNLLDNLRSGDEVVIRSGPFTGYNAIFHSRLQDSERVQVLLKILQKHTIRVSLRVGQLGFKKQNRSLL